MSIQIHDNFPLIAAWNALCPYGWESHQGKCYFFGRDADLSREEAKAFCRNKGGFLAEPKSSIESQFLAR